LIISGFYLEISSKFDFILYYGSGVGYGVCWVEGLTGETFQIIMEVYQNIQHRLVNFMVIVLWILSTLSWDAAAQLVTPGNWTLLIQNAGVSAMHTTATYLNTVIIFDRTNFGASQLMLDKGRCRNNTQDLALTHDCWAHSIEYNAVTNTIRPLMIFTDTFCSSGAFAANGTLVQTGGWRDGARVIRNFVPCSNGVCDWNESQSPNLAGNRWYASNQILPDNRIIVVGGTREFTYEFVPKNPGEGTFSLPFLNQTRTSAKVENNLYPFLHLCSDGNLFIFANRDSILLDYKNNVVVKRYPKIPGDGPRNYPSTGSSVMLPLSASDGFKKVEVLICGGCPDNGFALAKAGNFIDALQNCGRMVITDANPVWSMENMTRPRTMGDMLLLPNGEVIIINGAQKGVAGWNLSTTPVFSPLLYRPNAPLGARFFELAPTSIARMYHSTANLLADARVLVAGSNPHIGYVLNGTAYPTELRLESFSPYYLDPIYTIFRPSITSVSSTSISYGAAFSIVFSVAATLNSTSVVQVNIYAPSFTTHSYSMNQRLLTLAASTPALLPNSTNVYSLSVTAPPSGVAAPPGYYMMFVVNGVIPSVAQWIQVGAT
jgi:hypothetical protein